MGDQDGQSDRNLDGACLPDRVTGVRLARFAFTARDVPARLVVSILSEARRLAAVNTTRPLVSGAPTLARDARRSQASCRPITDARGPLRGDEGTCRGICAYHMRRKSSPLNVAAYTALGSLKKPHLCHVHTGPSGTKAPAQTGRLRLPPLQPPSGCWRRAGAGRIARGHDSAREVGLRASGPPGGEAPRRWCVAAKKG